MPRFASDPVNVEAEVEGPNELPFDPAVGVPAGYMLCEDGKVYRKRIVSGVQTIALAGGLGRQDRSERAEAAMGAAVNKAVGEGIAPGTPEMLERILAARDEVLKEG